MIHNRGVVTAASFTSMFFLGVGTAIIGAASGNIGLSPYQTGLLISVQNIGFTFAVLVSGALADTREKTRLLAAGSLVLGVSFFLFYLWEPYLLNLLVMLFIGVGLGAYEGVADPMLLSIHKSRKALIISVNHFFVTFGCLAITVYLIFLPLADWRRSLVQSAAVVLALAVFYLFLRAGVGGSSSVGIRQRLSFLKTQGVLVVFLAAAVMGVGLELGLTGLLPSFLSDLRGYDPVAARLGLALFLGGIAAGRAVLGIVSRSGRIPDLVIGLFGGAALLSSLLFFLPLPGIWTGILLFLVGITISSLLPLLVTMTGLLYPHMSGTALGIVKLGIPIGGIVVPLILSLVSRWSSFQLSLGLFPLAAAAGCALVASSRGLIGTRLEERKAEVPG